MIISDIGIGPAGREKKGPIQMIGVVFSLGTHKNEDVVRLFWGNVETVDRML